MKVKIKVYFLKLCQVWCVAVSSQIGTFCAADKQRNSFRSTWNWPDSVGCPSQKQAIKTAESHSPTSQATVKILETSPPTWKRMIRPTEWGTWKGHSATCGTACGLCSVLQVPPHELSPVLGWTLGDMAVCVISAPVSSPNTPNKSHWFNNQALVQLFLWSVEGSLSVMCIGSPQEKSVTTRHWIPWSFKQLGATGHGCWESN